MNLEMHEHGAALVEFAAAYRDLLRAGDPYESPKLDSARPATRGHPTPGAKTRRFRTTQSHVDAELKRLTLRVRRALGDDVEDDGRCGGCDRPFRGRTRRWSATEQAEAELRRLLAEGRLPVNVAIARVRDAVRCSERTVRDAARRAGVMRGRVSGQTVWGLEPGTSKGDTDE